MAFRAHLPWTSSPLIVNAPMGGFAGPDLAAAVSRAGGLGMIGALDDPATISVQLDKTAELLNASPRVQAKNAGLAVGVGLLLFILQKKRAEVLEVLARHRPAVIWLFAEPSLKDFGGWTAEIRAACPDSQIWIQTCSSSSAVELARSAKPDVLVMQGADAGGHGWERGAGVISLIPETRDALEREGLRVGGLVAAGGIADGRGVAAALSLGADAVVLGTRFLASKEVVVHPLFQKQVLETSDGAQQTVRAKVFDDLRGPNRWPQAYDGRAIVSNSYKDHVAGVGIDQIRERHAEALTKEDLGWGDSKRAVVWAGTGVGLVREIQPAADIVRQVRDGAKTRLEEAKARL